MKFYRIGLLDCELEGLLVKVDLLDVVIICISNTIEVFKLFVRKKSHKVKSYELR